MSSVPAGTAAAERAALCSLFASLGPAAPTLAGAWTTYDMAAHLVVRERRPDALAGVVLPPLHGWTARVERSVSRPYAKLVAQLRAGPPAWSPVGGLLRDVVNVHEFFVHHEDVRRGSGLPPRPPDPVRSAALLRLLAVVGRLLYARAGVPVELVAPERRLVVRGGPSPVLVTGPVDELVLFSFGRQAAAQVQLDGPPEAVARLRVARLGV